MSVLGAVGNFLKKVFLEGCRRAGLLDGIAEKKKIVAAHDSPMPEAAEGRLKPLFDAEMK